MSNATVINRNTSEYVIDTHAVERIFDHNISGSVKSSDPWDYLSNENEGKIISGKTVKLIQNGEKVRWDTACKIARRLHCDASQIIRDSSPTLDADDKETGTFTIQLNCEVLFPWACIVPFATQVPEDRQGEEVITPRIPFLEMDIAPSAYFNFTWPNTYALPATPQTLIEGIKPTDVYTSNWDFEITQEGCPPFASQGHCFNNIEELFFWQDGSQPNAETLPLLKSIFEKSKQLQYPLHQGLSFESMLNAVEPHAALQESLDALKNHHGINLFIADLWTWVPDKPFPEAPLKEAKRTVIIAASASLKRVKLSYTSYGLFSG